MTLENTLTLLLIFFASATGVFFAWVVNHIYEHFFEDDDAETSERT